MMCNQFGLVLDVSGAVRDGESRKRFGLTKKTPVHGIPYFGHLGQPIPRRWKRLHVSGNGDAKRRRWASVLGKRRETG